MDDDSLVSMNTAYMLTDLGHSVLEAPSAQHALHAWRQTNRFDVVITDYAMPGMNGLDLANEIQRTFDQAADHSRNRICRIAARRTR